MRLKDNGIQRNVEDDSKSNNGDNQEIRVEETKCLNRVFSAALMFFLFKVAEGILEPSFCLFLYDTVCLNRFPDSDYNRVCNNLSADHDKEAIIQEMSAKYMAYYKLLINLPAMATVLCCGIWSDKYGRITPIIFTCLGTTLTCVTYMASLLNILWESPNLAVILLGAGIRGVFGRSAIMTMAVNSYVSDHSPVHTRTSNLSNLIAMSNFGYLLGSSLSGILSENISSSYVFMIITILNTTCVLITYFLMLENKYEDDLRSRKGNATEFTKNNDIEKLHLISEREGATTYQTISKSEDFVKNDVRTSEVDKCDSVQLTTNSPNNDISSDQETIIYQDAGKRSLQTSRNSLQEQNQDQFAEDIKMILDAPISAVVTRKNRIKGIFCFLNYFCLLVKKRPGQKRSTIWILLLVLYLHQMNKSGEGDIYLLFVKRFPLSISKSTYGYLVSVTYASLGIFAFMVPKILKLISCHVSDSTLAIVGIAIKIGSLIFLSFSHTVWMLVIAAILTGAISVTVSSVRSMVSKIVDAEELGRAFSIISFGETLCNFLGSLIYTSIYPVTAHVSPGISFIVEAGVYTTTILLMVKVSQQTRHPDCSGYNHENVSVTEN